jgi:hypothetical protein
VTESKRIVVPHRILDALAEFDALAAELAPAVLSSCPADQAARRRVQSRALEGAEPHARDMAKEIAPARVGGDHAHAVERTSLS